jgi:hypothetical protein
MTDQGLGILVSDDESGIRVSRFCDIYKLMRLNCVRQPLLSCQVHNVKLLCHAGSDL